MKECVRQPGEQPQKMNQCFRLQKNISELLMTTIHVLPPRTTVCLRACGLNLCGFTNRSNTKAALKKDWLILVGGSSHGLMNHRHGTT